MKRPAIEMARRVILCFVLLATGVALERSASSATSGVSLQPAAGQFVPLDGSVVGRLSGGGIYDPSENAVNSVTVGTTYHASVSAAGVPADASSVALEFVVKAAYNGGLVAGDTGTTADTSMSWPPSVSRYGFDTVQPDDAGDVYFRTFANGTNASLVTSTFVVRVHGYYTGVTATTAGSTYVGKSPQLAYDQSVAMPSDTSVQIAGLAGVPNDGSATSVALQSIAVAPSCDGAFGLYPDGSSRGDWDAGFSRSESDANFDLVELPSSGRVKLHVGSPTSTCSTSPAKVEIRIWVRGYFSSPTFSTPGATYVPVQEIPLDTTRGTGTMLSPMSNGCAVSSPIPANGGCTFQVAGVGEIPTSGVDGVGVEVLVVGNGTSGGSVVLTSSSSGSLSTTVAYTSAGRYTNFEMATYAATSNGKLYVYNTGNAPVHVIIRVHGYNLSAAAPDEPAGVHASKSDSGVEENVEWTPPSSDGGAAVTRYRVDLTDTTTGLLDQSASVDPATFEHDFVGLQSQDDYTVTVTAITDVGNATAPETPDDANAAIADADAAGVDDQMQETPTQSSATGDSVAQSRSTTQAGTPAYTGTDANSSAFVQQWGRNWTMAVTVPQRQKRSNWCGPAATRAVLSGLWVHPPSQSELANYEHTDSIGFTVPMRIASALNYYDNIAPGIIPHDTPFTFYKTYRNIKPSNLFNHMAWYIAVDNDTAIMTAYSRQLWYPHAPLLEMHYLVIVGFNYNYLGNGPALMAWDPEDGLNHVITYAKYNDATVAGLVVVPVYDDDAFS